MRRARSGSWRSQVADPGDDAAGDSCREVAPEGDELAVEGSERSAGRDGDQVEAEQDQAGAGAKQRHALLGALGGSVRRGELTALLAPGRLGPERFRHALVGRRSGRRDSGAAR